MSQQKNVKTYSLQHVLLKMSRHWSLFLYFFVFKDQHNFSTNSSENFTI